MEFNQLHTQQQTMLKTWQRTLQLRFNLSSDQLNVYAVQGQNLPFEILELLHERALLAPSLAQFNQDMAQLLASLIKP